MMQGEGPDLDFMKPETWTDRVLLATLGDDNKTSPFEGYDYNNERDVSIPAYPFHGTGFIPV
jgi:hypothetical protein